MKGTATLDPAPLCGVGEQCPPQLGLQFAELDAAALQAALLGAHQQDTIFSSLVARFTPTSAQVWPRVDGTVKADSLILGPVNLQNAVVSLRILPTGAEFTNIDARLFGGRIHVSGKLANGEKPKYGFEGTFAKLTGSALCELFSLQCTGGPIDGNGKVELSGFTEKDLMASATGALLFEWRHGAIRANPATQIPKSLTRFDRWNGDVTIANGEVTLKQSEVQHGLYGSDADATITFANPPVVKFGGSTPADAKQ